jgi:hypothetical protein
MKKILEISLYRLQDGEHYQFGANVLSVLSPSFAASLNMTAQREVLQHIYDKMDAVYLINRAYQQTSTIVKLNRERRQQFRGFRAAITFYLNNGTEAQKAAATPFIYLLKPYKTMNRSYANNTADMFKFIMDVKSAVYAPHLATLNLTDVVNQLEAVNDHFDALYISRSDELYSREVHEKIRILRRDWDVAFRVVAQVLPALHLVETDAAKKETIAEAIDEINGLLLQLKHTMSRRGVKSSANDTNHDPSNETPEHSGDDGGGGGQQG